MNIVKAISLKLVAMVLFAVMSTIIRYAVQQFPIGQVVFCRSAFAIIPILLIYGWRGELKAAVYTARPFGHIGRGMIAGTSMFLNFGALARLPLVDATALNFASPLMTVALAAVILKERVRIFRWSAVAVGFLGVLVMLYPMLDFAQFTGAAASTALIGVACAMGGAVLGSGSNIQTRRLTTTETTPSIVFYFSLYSALIAVPTLPFAWSSPTPLQWLALAAIGVLGGLAHLVLTESYRFAPASVVAPFDYTQLFWVFLLGYFCFGELPTIYVWVGSGIIMLAGLFVIWRERQLGLRRVREAEAPAR
jgi:drug/metabolite transporter (DMT)-like permease